MNISRELTERVETVLFSFQNYKQIKNGDEQTTNIESGLVERLLFEVPTD